MSGECVVLALVPGFPAWRAAFLDDALSVVDRFDEIATPRVEDDAVVRSALEAARKRGLAVRGLAFALSDGPRWLDTAAELGRCFELPWSAERKVASVMEGERIRGIARETASVALLDADGPALTMRIDGRDYAGAHGLAGTITHLGLDRTGSLKCSCGRNGCLGVLLDAGAAAPEPPRPATCVPASSRSLGWLAVAGITLVNILNPELLIVAGAPVEDAAALDWFAATVRAGCLGPTRAGLRGVSGAHPDSALVGAAARFAVINGSKPSSAA